MPKIALTLDRESNWRSRRKITFGKSAYCQLKVLKLDDEATSIEFQGKDADRVRQYLKDMAEGSSEICRVKLLLVGNERQGKTSLIHFLQNGKSFEESNGDEPSRTDGIDIKIWREDVDGKQVTISSWDFAGQQVSTFKLFLSYVVSLIIIFRFIMQPILYFFLKKQSTWQFGTCHLLTVANSLIIG